MPVSHQGHLYSLALQFVEPGILIHGIPSVPWLGQKIVRLYIILDSLHLSGVSKNKKLVLKLFNKYLVFVLKNNDYILYKFAMSLEFE